MPETDNTIYPSFCDFVESVILPKLLANPSAKRLDYREKGGDPRAAGYFTHFGRVWQCNYDSHFEPLLLAYYQEKYVKKGTAFLVTKTIKVGEPKLGLSDELKMKRPSTNMGDRYLYIYEKP